MKTWIAEKGEMDTVLIEEPSSSSETKDRRKLFTRKQRDASRRGMLEAHQDFGDDEYDTDDDDEEWFWEQEKKCSQRTWAAALLTLTLGSSLVFFFWLSYTFSSNMELLTQRIEIGKRGFILFMLKIVVMHTGLWRVSPRFPAEHIHLRSDS